MEKNSKIYIAGHNGMVGSAIVRNLKTNGFNYLIYTPSDEYDLTDQQIVSDFIIKEKPDYVIDAAAKYAGYHADMTRTPVVGEATDKHYEIYNTVKGSQQAGCDAAKAGMSCKDMDSITRDYITERGYGEYYNHGTGHGLGLEIHTEPRLSQLSTQTLAVNNVVTIEPGIYLAGWGGVRIEDDVIIKEGGCEILNKTTKDLVVLN